MLRTVLLIGCLVVGAVVPLMAQSPPARRATTSASIDTEAWAAIATAVARGDIAALARTYHADAVLVSENGTSAISSALAGWGKQMQEARKAGRSATVAFRFSSRQDDSTTAFERGIFKYTTIDKGRAGESVYIPFEALLVRSGGTWRTLMERQLAPVTVDAWNRLPR